ncbi:unnamed protein product [Miscanthus lutarioriparius]|uniref:Uncharacterized protein n=1 Tax=Miscanthus lutarioriparius TaxID=422564 RepID=A0A811RW74_9POAL|nr:unnamed protein product [Miscanthus lutarioriparius]
MARWWWQLTGKSVFSSEKVKNPLKEKETKNTANLHKERGNGTDDQVEDVLLYASSEVAEVAGVVMPALVKATALYHWIASHEEAPPNPPDDGAEHVAGAAGAS